MYLFIIFLQSCQYEKNFFKENLKKKKQKKKKTKSIHQILKKLNYST